MCVHDRLLTKECMSTGTGKERERERERDKWIDAPGRTTGNLTRRIMKSLFPRIIIYIPHLGNIVDSAKPQEWRTNTSNPHRRHDDYFTYQVTFQTYLPTLRKQSI